jgi:hypothetical protein
LVIKKIKDMKTYSIFSLKKIGFAIMSVVLVLGCQNDFSDLQDAKYSANPDVFIDIFSPGLNFAAFGGTVVLGFQVDKDVSYNKTAASMRFDVPNVNDPDGAYVGGSFFTKVGRDLSGYDALTFWAKSSQSATIDVIGFGNDFGANKYQASISGLILSTVWKKYIIPIPDPSKLKIEKGMLFLSEGPENGKGYTFWIDEVKFEKLGTVSNGQGSILNGADKVETSFIGVTRTIDGLISTFNLPNGINQSVNVTPAYFVFTSSNPAVATVDEKGVVTTIGTGTAVITAKLGANAAKGSLTINSLGTLPAAPTPTQTQNNVKSVFSDAYAVETPINFDPKFGGSTTATSLITFNNNSFLSYTNNNYTGIMFENKIDGSSLAFMHVDVYAQQAGVQVEFQIRDVGANGIINTNIITGQPELDDKDYRFSASNLTVNGWNSFNIPLTGNLTNQKNNLGAVIVVGGPKFILDNIYFYNDGSIIPSVPTTAAPTPTVSAANVLSVFSDAYTNVAGTDLNPNWGQTTVASQVSIAGNNTLKYSGLNYQGIVLGSAQNVSTKTYLHLDYYTSNSTSLKVYLISPGPVEKPYVLTVPSSGAPSVGGWKSIDIPLTAFSPVVLSNIIQLKFDGNGNIYLDNIYFRN